MNAPIVLAYASDEKFAKPALVSLDSLLRNTSSRVEIFFLDCGLSERSRKKILEGVERFSARIEFLPAPTLEPSLLLFPENSFSAANYARIHIPELIDREEVLYLDSDTVLLGDIKELWDSCRLRPGALQAAPDYFANFQNIFLHADVFQTVKHFRALERLGIPDAEPYFNSGVLFFRREPLLAFGLKEKILALAKQEPVLCHLADQSLLNVALRGAITPIDFAWNFQIPQSAVRRGEYQYPGLADLSGLKPKLMHFTSAEKPWLQGASCEEFRYYVEAEAKVSWE